ncbi:MAG: ABC-type spermidine/putrescine transport system, ATPase component [Bacteroidetes bacterium]|nr:ABC-type spermidine/putrescine transport system, ATPase component [Bacteroidota bacterium]
MSLQLNKGEVLALLGKSGSGKTTLIKCIYGLEDIQQGEVLIGEDRVLGPAYSLMPGHKDMSLVSQDFYVLDNHTVEENIWDKLIGITNEAKLKRSTQLLKLLDLVNLRNTKARFLSSGQKQRVAIARALAIIPEVLLLDEPFSNLDKILTDKLFSFVIKEVKKNKTSVILITHVADEALKYADRIGILDSGKITQIGEKWKVFYKPKNTKLAGLLGDCNIIKKEDVQKPSKEIKSKFLIRPDKLKTEANKSGNNLPVTVLHSSYNGKCHEILAETKSGHSVVIYSNKKKEIGDKITVGIEI